MQWNHKQRMCRQTLPGHGLRRLLVTLVALVLGTGMIAPSHAADADSHPIYLPIIHTWATGSSTAPETDPPPTGQDQTPVPGEPAPTPSTPTPNTPTPSTPIPGTPAPDSTRDPAPTAVVTPNSTTIVVAPEEHPNLPVIPGLSYCPDIVAAEGELAALMAQHPGQGRAVLECDPLLTQVARARARDMALRDYVDHTTPDGLGPNQLVVQAGYVLPADYSLEAGRNNIESLAAGSSQSAAVWETWMSLPSHRAHLLAEDAFFVPQIRYGIGYVYVADSRYRHYWVVLTAPAPSTD